MLKIGTRISPRTVRRYMPEAPLRPADPKQRWITFVRNHAKAIVASDFFVVVTATFHLLYVFVIIEVATRRPTAPTNTQTKCLTAILLPFPLMSFDISFVNPDRGEFYLGDRSSKGLDVIDTNLLQYKRTVGLDKPFAGLVLNAAGTAVNNALSGPAGVAGHGRWLYGGDGNSTLHVIDLDEPGANVTKQVLSSGGKFRLDEMALTNDGTLLLTANNADDPPFVTLFAANGDNATSNVSIIQMWWTRRFCRLASGSA